MKILALDQGTHLTGYAIGVDGAITTVDVLRVPPKKGEPADKRQRAMKEKIRQLLFEEQPDHLAVEGVHLGENPATLIMLAEFRGRVIGMAEDLGYFVIDVPSHEVMSYLHLPVGTGRAMKKARAQFVATADVKGQVFATDGGNPLLSEDMADAVILLRCAETTIRLRQIAARAASGA